jgi:CheY-like chemotaxis protein
MPAASTAKLSVRVSDFECKWISELMDGYEVARRLRNNPNLKEVKLITVTGYGQEADRLQPQQAGFDYHLVKLVDSQNLMTSWTRL